MPAVRLLQRRQDAGGQQQYRFTESDFHDSVCRDDPCPGAVRRKGAYAGSERKAFREIKVKVKKSVTEQKKFTEIFLLRSWELLPWA